MIGIIDSGVGGISLAKILHAQNPNLELLYIADNEFMPYGEKPLDLIQQRSMQLSNFLVQHGVHNILLACNTATALAIDMVRSKFTHINIVGIEPAIKVALQQPNVVKVGVLSTENTLQSERYTFLKTKLDKECSIIDIACHNFALMVEQQQSPDYIEKAIIDTLAPVFKQHNDINVLTLGCTHYVFLRKYIEVFLYKRNIKCEIIDNSIAVINKLLLDFDSSSALSSGNGKFNCYLTDTTQEYFYTAFLNQHWNGDFVIIPLHV